MIKSDKNSDLFKKIVTAKYTYYCSLATYRSDCMFLIIFHCFTFGSFQKFTDGCLPFITDIRS